MDEFLKMDIFFFIATVGVVVLTFFAAFVLWRLERILKNVEYISISSRAKESGASQKRAMLIGSSYLLTENRVRSGEIFPSNKIASLYARLFYFEY